MTTRLIDKWVAEKLGWRDGERQSIPDYGEDLNATLPELVRLSGDKGFRLFTDSDYGLTVELREDDIPTHLHAATPAECLFEALCWLLNFDTNDTKDADGRWIEVQP